MTALEAEIEYAVLSTEPTHSVLRTSYSVPLFPALPKPRHGACGSPRFGLRANLRAGRVQERAPFSWRLLAKGVGGH